MKLPAIVTSDLHLTANPRDAYRWGLFPWLVEQAKEHKAKTLCILGDLTDAKDLHPSTLTNKLVETIVDLRRVYEKVLILMGNHDYLKYGDAFFNFLSFFEGVRFYSKVGCDDDPDCSVRWFPYSKHPAEYFPEGVQKSFSSYDYVFLHQTVKGSIASNGQEMDGELSGKFECTPRGRIYSGDIHVPQRIGDVEYVGSPYHVHFGDKFKPRVILIEAVGKERTLYFDTIHRVTAKIKSVEELSDYGLRKGDQVKVRLELSASERHEWDRHKREVMAYCKRNDIVVHGIELLTPKTRRRLLDGTQLTTPKSTAEEIVFEFAKVEDLGAEMFETAMEVLDGN